jgi:hypothetical protein
MRPSAVRSASPSGGRSRILDLPLNLCFLCTGVLLYTPLLVMYLSGKAGHFTFASLGWPVVACACALLVPWGLSMRWPSAVTAVDTLLVAPVLYVLITSTFVPVHGNVLDGSETLVTRSDRLLHDGLMLVCAAAAFAALFSAAARNTVSRIGYLLGFFAMAATAYMAISLLPMRTRDSDTLRSVAALSPHRNVIVLMMDMLQGGFGADYFRRTPEVWNDFDGFAFYHNAASFAPFTALSYSGFMSGGYPGPDQIQNGSVKDTVYYKDNLVEDMVASGYATHYSSIIPFQYRNAEIIRIPDDLGLTRKDNFFLSALTMRGRYIPYAYLPFGLKYMPWLQREFGMFSKADARDSFTWFLHNIQVDEHIDKSFVWFHTLVTHQPIRLDRNGRFSMKLTPDDAGGEVAFVFGELREFLGRLKAIGVYDNADILLLSDHGYNIMGGMKAMPAGTDYALAPFGNGITVGQYEPLFMVKRAGAHGPLRFDDTAVTLLDIRKSLRELASPGSGAEMPGYDLFGREAGSPNRTVPVIRFVGASFDSTRDFTDLTNWRRDTLRLPLAANYSRSDSPPSNASAAPAASGP